MSVLDEYSDLTEIEQSCRVIDELLGLLFAVRGDLDFATAKDAMTLIAARLNANPSFPVTKWLLDTMVEQGYVTRHEPPG
jgi:hypothetical protein